MPLTEKGAEIKKAMQSEYGPEKGERVFYASKNAGKITGVDNMESTTAHAHPHGVGAVDMNAVPIADCYKDAARDSEAPAYNSVPLIDPTAIGGMGPSENDGAGSAHSGYPTNKVWHATHPETGEVLKNKNAKYGELAPRFETPEKAMAWGNKHHGFKDDLTQPSGMSEPTDVAPPAPHAGCDPAMSFDWSGNHDYSGDVNSRMGGLPETISQQQMVNFAAAMNYGEGITK